MTISEKLFASRLAITVCLVLFTLVGYVILAVYTDQIKAEVVRFLTDSFGHLEGELANN